MAFIRGGELAPGVWASAALVKKSAARQIAPIKGRECSVPILFTFLVSRSTNKTSSPGFEEQCVGGGCSRKAMALPLLGAEYGGARQPIAPGRSRCSSIVLVRSRDG